MRRCHGASPATFTCGALRTPISGGISLILGAMAYEERRLRFVNSDGMERADMYAGGEDWAAFVSTQRPIPVTHPASYPEHHAS